MRSRIGPSNASQSQRGSAKWMFMIKSQSWNAPGSGIHKNRLKGKKAQPRKQGPLEQRTISCKAPQFHLGFLEPVYVIVNTLQLAPIGRPIKFCIRER